MNKYTVYILNDAPQETCQNNNACNNTALDLMA
jgi:hypothetical protein